jgi:hypothetical protein
MFCHASPSNLPLAPSGMAGSTRRLASTFCSSASTGWLASSTDEQEPHTTDTVCPSARNSTPAPQLGQESAAAEAVGPPAGFSCFRLVSASSWNSTVSPKKSSGGDSLKSIVAKSGPVERRSTNWISVLSQYSNGSSPSTPR